MFQISTSFSFFFLPFQMQMPRQMIWNGKKLSNKKKSLLFLWLFKVCFQCSTSCFTGNIKKVWNLQNGYTNVESGHVWYYYFRMYAADVAEPATKDKYAHVCCCAMLLPPQQQLLFHIISWFVIVVMFSIIFVFQSKFIAVFGIIIVACHRHQYVNCKENSELFHGIETEVLLVDFGAFLWTFRLFSL